MSFFDILLYIHVAGGGISLVTGLIILFLKKGNLLHKQLGRVFFYAMLSSSLVALPMSYLHPNYFLFIIGVFTAYMLLSGKRSLVKKSIKDVSPIDWTLSGLMLIFSIAFLSLGVFQITRGIYFGLVFITFGGISLLFVYQDYSNFRSKSRIKNFWLTTHLQRMTGSYIASVTAFVVVNNMFVSAMAAWLAPTIVLTPMIIIWSRKYGIQQSADNMPQRKKQPEQVQ